MFAAFCCCRCGTTLGHDAGAVLVLAPGVRLETRARLQCGTCGARRWWCPAPTLREQAAAERWRRGKAVEYIEA